MKKTQEQIGRMESQMKQWGVKIDELVAKADKADNDVKVTYYKQIDNLKAKYQVAQSKLEEAKKGGGEKWEGFKAGIEHAWKEVEKAFGSLKG
jgi:uncharacterized coiled-coil DUF342 family protein